jgi:uncharacterized phage protein gp47/JayE
MKISVTQDEIKAKIISAVESDDKLKKLTNLNSNSRWMLIINAVTKAMFYFINGILAYLYASIFPQSSDRYSLARHLESEGLSFKEATKATSVICIGSTSVPEIIRQIPQGSIVKTKSSDPKCYIIDDGGVITPQTVKDSRGFYTTSLSVTAIDTGSDYNVPADAIVELESSIDGIDVLYNPSAATGGSDDESESAAFVRLVDAKNAKSRGSKTWYKSEAESILGVKQAIVVPRYSGRGTVGIIIIGYGGQAAQSVLDAVSSHFNTDENDPASGAHVVVALPSTWTQNYTISIWYDSSKGSPTDEELTAALAEYIANLGVGEDHVLSAIETMLMNKFSLKDVKIISPSDNITVPSDMLSSLGSAAWIKQVWVDA